MFTAWMLGFLLLMALLVWLAVVVGLPDPYLGLVVAVLLAAVVAGALVLIRKRWPRRR